MAENAYSRLNGVVPRWEFIKDEATNPDNYISGKAVDHYHRFREDLDIVRELNLNTYRFSVEWSRIEPEPGRFDQKALDHYETIVNHLLERNIEPFLMLHHFTNPVWLEEAGGWHNSKTPELFARFTEVVTERLGGKVRYWITVNEANTYIFMRYLDGNIWPAWPNAESSIIRALKAKKYFTEAHKQARDKIKTNNPDSQIGFVHTSELFFGSGIISRLAARLMGYFTNKYITRPVTKYCDFIALHHYNRWRVVPGLTHPQNWVKSDYSKEKSDIGWVFDYESVYEATQMYKKENLPIYIDEHGLADQQDAYREEFITHSLRALQQSIQDGADVRGYFHWSLLDNFEWSERFWPKMGLVEVDRTTQARRIRASAYAYQRIIANNGVDG